MCVFACVYVCMCICMYVCMSSEYELGMGRYLLHMIFVRVLHVHEFIRACVCMYVCMCVYMYVCMYLCMMIFGIGGSCS